MEFELSGDIQFINEKELLEAFYSYGFKNFKHFEGDYFVLISQYGKIRVSLNGNSYLFSYNIEVSDEEYAKKVVETLKNVFAKLKTGYIIELNKVNGNDGFEHLDSFRNWEVTPPSKEV